MQNPLVLVETVCKYFTISGPKKLHVSMDFHPRLEQQPPQGEIYVRVSSRVPFLAPKNKQSNLAFLSGRLISSIDLASCVLSRSSSVQRSFLCGDVIAITSWAPAVVKLVRPVGVWMVTAVQITGKVTNSRACSEGFTRV